MIGNDKRRLKLDFMIACSMLAAGVVISGVSIAQIRAEGRVELAQATQWLATSRLPGLLTSFRSRGIQP